MTLKEMLEQLKKARAELSQGHFVAAWRLSLPLQESGCDFLESVGVKEFSDEDKAVVVEIKAVSAECAELCATVTASGVGAEKIGDGKIRDFLLDLFKQVIPILLPIIIG